MEKSQPLWLVRLSIIFCFSTSLEGQTPHILELNSDWKITPVEQVVAPKPSDLGQNIKQSGYTAQLPTTVMDVLWQNKAIENPFLSENARRIAWLEKKDWTFECHFDVDNKVLNAEKVDLILRGVDTYSRVFLNDALILKTDNIFQTWSADVITLLQAKNNKLKIVFTMPNNKNKEFGEAFEFDEEQMPVEQLSKSDSLLEETLEKRVISIGLGSVELKAWNRLALNEVFIKQNKLSEERAELEAQTVVSLTQPSKIHLKITFGEQVMMKDTFLNVGLHRLYLPFVVLSPKLWWTKILGNPYLYNIKAILTNNDGQSEVWKSQVGLRKMTASKPEKGDDETTILQLNGKPITQKYMPEAYWTSVNLLIKQGEWRALVKKVADSGNPIIYLSASMSRLPPLDFYELCDENGILVCQDFMLSNTVYMNNRFVQKQLEKEADVQINRLRSFACIGVWRGDFEPFNVFGKTVPPNNRLHTLSNQVVYKQLFQNTLPKIVAQYTNETTYETRSKWQMAEPEEALITTVSMQQDMFTENSSVQKQNKPIQDMPMPDNGIAIISKGVIESNEPIAEISEPKEKVVVTSKAVPETKQSVENVQIASEKPIEPPQRSDLSFNDVFLTPKIENDTFKLTVKNDRSTRALGDFLVDVYDLNDRLLFNDARMMLAEPNSKTQFYRYDLKTMIQGARLSDVKIVTTWKDGYNLLEWKKTFSIEPNTLHVTSSAAVHKAK